MKMQSEAKEEADDVEMKRKEEAEDRGRKKNENQKY
jgi:hypothetical protein